MHTESNHTFAICAYKESPYLEESIQSLLNQTVKSKIIIITSTPNNYIQELAGKYSIEVFINIKSGIVNDWNYAYERALTKYVTLAHQDDIYTNQYTEILLSKMKRVKKSLIAFTDYSEIRNNTKVENNTMLKVKRLMLLPLNITFLNKSRFVRRRILSFGCPICCPSVMYNKENLPKEIFQVGYRSCEDWQAWEKLSKLKGEFIYCNHRLTYHRIHEESETTAIIGDNVRTLEDYDMFCKFWPKIIAKFLVKFYSKAEASNNLSRDIIDKN